MLSRPFLVEAAPFCRAFRRLESLSLVGYLRWCRRYLDLGVFLTVPLALAVSGLVLVLEDGDLRGLGVADDLRLDVDLGQRGRVRGDGVAVDQEDGRQ